MPYQYKLLIGGIGDDAHSVGIRLLELGFKYYGYHVKNLGIRNSIENFFVHANDFDIILLSNKNGHAELHLADFPKMLNEYVVYNNSPKLWYLGGSLAVSGSYAEIKKKFIGYGFTNVYPQTKGFEQILNDIGVDIHRFNIPKREITTKDRRYDKIVTLDYSSIKTAKWTIEELENKRKSILSEWHTGAEVMNGDYAPFSAEKSIDTLLWKHRRKKGTPLLQPRTGVAEFNEQMSLLQYLERNGSDINSVQMDAASRSKMYDKAKMGLNLSIQRKSSMLNGFPIPIHGVREVQKLVNSLNHPFQLRGGGPDHRFAYEIALKGGISAVEGGFLCYLLPYDKETSPVDSLAYWQYIDRLCSMYQERYKLTINREYFGVLTATLIEPSLAIVVNIIQSLLSAEQGIRSITVGYAEQGNRIQDIAAMRALEDLVHRYLLLFNHRSVRLTTVFHQYMAAFPSDYLKAQNLIYNSSITGRLANATKIMVKTAVEAIQIPDRFENAKALNLCKKGITDASASMVNWQAIETEKYFIEKQVKQIMDVVFELGNNKIAVGAIKAVESGVIDIPWSPSNYNNNQVVTIRDTSGAIRFEQFGNMPFDEEIKEFHLEKVTLRKKAERDSSLFSLLEKDLSRIWQNDFKTWPLDYSYVN